MPGRFFKSALEIQKLVKRGAELTRSLVEQTHTRVPTPDSVQLNEAIRDSLPIFDRVAGERVALTLNLQKNLPEVRVDRAQFIKALRHLVENAREAMDDGGVLKTETATTEVHGDSLESPSGEYVVVCVTDDGCGVDSEIEEKIFNPFFTTKKGQPGKGLGLSLVQSFAIGHEGACSFDRKDGGGSIFRILLPKFASERVKR